MLTDGKDDLTSAAQASIHALSNTEGRLSKSQGKELYTCMGAHENRLDEHGHGSAHGGHHAKPRSILTALASAIINFLLMFGLCCAYGIIMFDVEWNAQHRGLGVKMNLVSALISGLLLAYLSKVKVAIGGPDLNPVVFLGMFSGTIAEEVAKEHGLVYPGGGSRRLMEHCGVFDPADFLRRLGGGSEVVTFCTGTANTENAQACNSYHAELQSTMIFATAVSSAILGILFFSLGRFKLTKLVTYVPTHIMEAFLSCVGYKVFKYALKFCEYEPKQFIPAACIGVPLYMFKALHIGNPAIVIPTMLLVPLGIFYIILYGSGGDIESARNDGWMFGEIQNADFWTVWDVTLGSSGGIGSDINFKAWVKTLPDLAIMIVVCILDCLLKLSSTESKLPVKADKDYEIQVYGLCNFFTTLCGSSVGYMQLKFNVINYGVMGNVDDNRGGILYALFCGACFFWTTDLFNYMPRFFLSTLLFFAGSGFVAENLWGSRKYLSTAEWQQIFIILAVFILTGSLLYAVILGGLLTGAFFIYRYAQIPVIEGRPLKGGVVVPKERKPGLDCMQCCIRHMSNHCLLVVRLRGFIFFASAQKLTVGLEEYIKSQELKEVPEYRRTRWVVFDCVHLDGLDSSASKSFAKLVKGAKAMNVSIMWSGMSTKFCRSLEQCGTIESEHDWFHTFDEAVQHTDSLLTDRMLSIQEQWVKMNPMLECAHEISCRQGKFDPFANVLPLDMQRFGCPWLYCGRLNVKAYETLLWKPGQAKSDLFLVHSGSIGLFTNIPNDGEKGCWEAPIAIYTHGCFLNRQALLEVPTRNYAVALEDGQLLFWNELLWSKMSRERPYMAAAIMKMALQQEQEDSATSEKDKTGQDLDREYPDFTVVSQKATLKVAAQLRHRLQGLSIAQALEDTGFFEFVRPDEEHALPTLPEYISKDLDIAFQTYAEGLTSGGQSGEPAKISVCKIDDALKYAGIGNILLNSIPKDSLTRVEFRALCLHGLLTPLSNSMVEKVRAAFDTQKELVDIGSGICCEAVNRSALGVLLEHLFKHKLRAADVDGIANMWGGSFEHGIDFEAFVVIVSRYVRMHIYDLAVLRAFREFMGQAELKDGDKITKEMIMKAQPDLTGEQAEEMIWCLDFDDERSDDKALDFRKILAILHCATDQPSPLPPEPSTSIIKDPTPDLDPKASGWLRSATMGIQNPDSWDLQGKDARKRKTGASMTFSRFSGATHEEMEEEEAKIDTCQKKLLQLLDDPKSSTAANMLSVFMGVMILISVLTLFLEPLISPQKDDDPMPETEKNVWLGFEVFFTVIFTIEYLLNFAVCNAFGTQRHREFLRDPMRICDVVAVLPFYIDQTIDMDNPEFRLFRVARLLRLSRLVRLGRLSKENPTLPPIAMILVVIWGIYMKNGLSK